MVAADFPAAFLYSPDYLYVTDIVAGYLRLAECLEDPALHGQAFNFGMDDPKTVPKGDENAKARETL